MAYNPNRPTSGPHRSTPLIARPSSNSHQNPVPPRPAAAGVPQGYLGNMMGGALAGMGYASPTMGQSNNQYPSQQIPPYYPPPLQQQQQTPYQYQQQQHGYYAQQYPGYPPQQPFPSTSTSSYPPPPSNPAFSSLPSRPSHSALPPAATHTSPSTSTNQSARAQKPPPRQTEFACKLEGCKFVSRSRRTTREHEEDRHLMFEPGREPKPWSGSLKPLEGAVIEGTGISLDTPEAVAKWIADRKKRWPSKKVVEEKEKAREERIKAGLEEAPRVRGAGRGRGRGRCGMMESSGRGGGRGGYSSGSQVRGRESETKTDEAEEPAKKKLKTGQDHSGSSSSSSDSSSDSGSDLDSDAEDDGPETIPAVSKEALKALLGDEAEEDDDNDEDADDDEPVEEQSSKPAEGDLIPAPDSAPPSTKRFQVVCRHWRKGNCALGDAECPYLHSIPNDQPLPPPRRNRPHPRQAPHNPFARPFQDAFQLLEEQDLKHVVSDLLQVVDFLKANDWLRGVEIRAGQMDEESGIEVLDQKEEQDKPKEEEEKTMIIEEVVKNEEELTEETPQEVKPPILSQPPPTVPTTTQRPSGLGLVADYASSDEEDEEAEEQVKQALLLPASSS
ncbi:hypothetical protein JCM3765_004508 [Sporobolomyces pararoseus]